MEKAVDLITNVVGVLAAVLGIAGYVLVLGGAILWLRLLEVDLPPEVPVSLASREELIAIGAQAVAVWVLLVAALGGLAAWIVTGDPARRHFHYPEAGLSLAVAIATLLAIGNAPLPALIPTGLAVAGACGAFVLYWPSTDRVIALLLPIGVGAGLGTSLALMDNRNGFATAAGAICIFGALILLTPKLQQWRARMEANRNALAQIEDEGSKEDDGPLSPLAAALKQGPRPQRSPAISWIGRIAFASVALLALGVISVGSQLDHDENFHEALVTLANGDCVEGTYVVRGSDQIVIGHPKLDDGDEEQARIATIPVAQVLDVQVYGKSLPGVDLTRDDLCTRNQTEVLVLPAKPDTSTASKDLSGK